MPNNLDETAAGQATALVNELYERLEPETAIVTLGRVGTLARIGHRIHRASVPATAHGITHGAGAAFSAGYAHAILTGASIEDAVGTTRCATPAAAVPRRLPKLTG